MTATDDDPRPREGNGQPSPARQRAPQNGAPRPEYFPLGYKAGFTQWWARLTPAQTEHKVLSFVPHLRRPPTHTQTGAVPPGGGATGVDPDASKEAAPVRTDGAADPYGPRQWRSELVALAGRNRFLNEFSVQRVGEETRNNLVLLHGYGAGLGLFYKNFEALSRRPRWKLYALDLLGMGRSSRPPFRIRAKEKEAKIREAENWFVDALEEWRVRRGVDKMTLLGHSLGGYLAVCYALKYPGHLHKLILVSPVGMPEDPHAVNEAMPEPDESTMANEFVQSQDERTASGITKRDAAAAPTGTRPPRKPLPKWLTTLWDANISPFSLVRLAGPLGPRFVSGWTTRRFAHLPVDEARALHDYAYSLFRQPGSGEYALAYILAPGAFARSPLIRRIHGVGRQSLHQRHADCTPDDEAGSARSADVLARARETGVPIVFVYGDKDWMDKAGGYAAAERIAAEKTRALASASEREKRLENGEAKTLVVANAGHHVYLDGWEEFNRVMLEEMRDVERRQGRLERLAGGERSGGVTGEENSGGVTDEEHSGGGG